MKLKSIAVLSALMIAGCAPMQMTDEDWAALVHPQERKIQEQSKCCTAIEKIEYADVSVGLKEFQFELSGVEYILKDGKPTPVLGMLLRNIDADQLLEIVSYSDRRRGMMRLDKLLFIRPNVIFMNSEFEVIAEIINPNMCWGSKDGGGGLWRRFSIPESATYALITPSIDVPAQHIDTRSTTITPTDVAGIAGGAIIEGISESRKSYHAVVYVGLEGLISVEAVPPTSRPLGRCR